MKILDKRNKNKSSVLGDTIPEIVNAVIKQIRLQNPTLIYDSVREFNPNFPHLMWCGDEGDYKIDTIATTDNFTLEEILSTNDFCNIFGFKVKHEIQHRIIIEQL